MSNFENLQPKLLEELEKQSNLNGNWDGLAHEHGARPKAKGHNALLFVKKLLEELRGHKKEALELGYASVKSAFLKLRRLGRPSPEEWTRLVPQDLRRAPNHWSTHEDLLEQKVQTSTGEVLALETNRFDKKFSPYKAQTKLEKLLPKLGELFVTADEQFEHEVRQLFFDPQTTYEEFEATVTQRFDELTNPQTHDFPYQESAARR